jgi:hypothetical protein
LEYYGKIINLSGLTFEDKVINNKKDILVFFYYSENMEYF